MSSELIVRANRELAQKRTKSDMIKLFITELGRDGLEDSAVKELIIELGRAYPENDMIKTLTETLELEEQFEQSRGESDVPWILFSLNNIAYAINSMYVLSIEILGKTTPMVEAPHYCPGITQSRGEMIELIDMRALFGSGDYQSAKADNPDAVFMMVVVEINDTKRGMIVDEILAVEHITKFEEKVDPSLTSQYIRTIARRDKSDGPVLILNQESLIEL